MMMMKWLIVMMIITGLEFRGGVVALRHSFILNFILVYLIENNKIFYSMLYFCII